jgi:hypothetical protein
MYTQKKDSETAHAKTCQNAFDIRGDFLAILQALSQRYRVRGCGQHRNNESIYHGHCKIIIDYLRNGSTNSYEPKNRVFTT